MALSQPSSEDERLDHIANGLFTCQAKGGDVEAYDRLFAELKSAIQTLYISRQEAAAERERAVVEAGEVERKLIATRVDKYIRTVLVNSDTGLGGYLSMYPMNATSLVSAIRWAIEPIEVLKDMSASVTQPQKEKP